MVKKIAIVFCFGALILFVLASVKSYYVETAANGNLFWNADEAYVFLRVTHTGYHMSCLQYPIEMIVEHLHEGRRPSDKSFSVSVFRVTPDKVQHYVVDDVHLGSIQVFEQSIYAGDFKSGSLMKWSGTGFIPASPTERRRLEENINRALAPNFSDVDGWSGRSGPPEGEFALKLAGKPISLDIKTGNTQGVASIEIVRVGQGRDRIWYLEHQPQKVNKTEYHRYFSKK